MSLFGGPFGPSFGGGDQLPIVGPDSGQANPLLAILQHLRAQAGGQFGIHSFGPRHSVGLMPPHRATSPFVPHQGVPDPRYANGIGAGGPHSNFMMPNDPSGGELDLQHLVELMGNPAVQKIHNRRAARFAVGRRYLN